MPSNNEYMRKYILRRYHHRRSEAISKLGGKCTNCGSTNDLQFDHIDSNTKSFAMSDSFSGWSEKRVEKELRKCQLLCKICHRDKHSPAKKSHGTISSYRYCRCQKCKQAKSKYNKEHKRLRSSSV